MDLDEKGMDPQEHEEAVGYVLWHAIRSFAIIRPFFMPWKGVGEPKDSFGNILTWWKNDMSLDNHLRVELLCSLRTECFFLVSYFIIKLFLQCGHNFVCVHMWNKYMFCGCFLDIVVWDTFFLTDIIFYKDVQELLLFISWWLYEC